MLFGYKNAFYDTASIYTWNKVYMQDYVKGLLDELSQVMDDFSSYRFYFIHATEGISPHSINDKYDKKILIQTGDQLGYEPMPEVMDAFYFVFKTHLRFQSGKYSNLAPYPLGLPSITPTFPIKPIGERRYDVFYSGNINNNRIAFYKSILNYKPRTLKWLLSVLLINTVQLLSKNKFLKGTELRVKSMLFRLNCYSFDDAMPHAYIRFTRSFQSGLGVNEYAGMLADSKIILSPKGFFNTECFRLYEALRQGCIVITEPQPGTSSFYDSKYYVEVENWKNIKEVIDRLLSDPNRMQQMSDDGVRYYHRCLSPKGVAHYVMDTLKAYIK